jgi:hypothetical protein
MAILVMIGPLVVGSLLIAAGIQRWGHTAPPSRS